MDELKSIAIPEEIFHKIANAIQSVRFFLHQFHQAEQIACSQFGKIQKEKTIELAKFPKNTIFNEYLSQHIF